VRRQDVARLLALALIWSASFAFIRVLVPVLGPFWVASARLLIAGVALVAWIAATPVQANLRANWLAYSVAGLLNCAVPFVLFAYAALHLPSSYLVIVNATAPLFGAVVAAVGLGERLSRAKLAGLLAGVAGVALVTRTVPVTADAQFALAVVAGLGAALCYALAAVWVKRRCVGLDPLAIAAWGPMLGGLMLLPFALPSHVEGPLTATIALNMAILALVCSGVAYLLYFRLIRDIGPTRALTVTFLMPALGMLWGAWFLDEAITPGMIGGAALIVGGTAAVLRVDDAWRLRRRIAA
jgi:drug/metabolite transporter (DMT)-like permease